MFHNISHCPYKKVKYVSNKVTVMHFAPSANFSIPDEVHRPANHVRNAFIK